MYPAKKHGVFPLAFLSSSVQAAGWDLGIASAIRFRRNIKAARIASAFCGTFDILYEFPS
eukprot:888284-Pelagomonas_calceolata.AAC.1